MGRESDASDAYQDRQMSRGSSYLPACTLSPRNDLSDQQVNAIASFVRETAFAIHKYFGPGFRERVYERSLIHRLRKAGLVVHLRPRVVVYDEDGTELLEEVLDLVVEEVLVVELKAVPQIGGSEIAQLLGYLKATAFRHGMLINFGTMPISIKKYVL